MSGRYPFLISIPHGGITIPKEVRDYIALTSAEILHYSDPCSRSLFEYRDRVGAVLDTNISRMIVDLNRPPYALPPRHSDGVVKFFTPEGNPVYHDNALPDIISIHRILMEHYFPYHAQIDHILLKRKLRIALDCHSMLPVGPPGQKDAGKSRPLICLGNNGNREGRPKKGHLATCPAEWMQQLAAAFREVFCLDTEVTINEPFSGGFITNAHYWHTGIPFIQMEINRSLYELQYSQEPGLTEDKIEMLRNRIWQALSLFWDEIRK
ncbi:MAG: N-formylglutamate amidohydrolase [Methanomicrobiales archaeon]|nr:N-formylglutamate amidohydrolase [Methanomicrobiales archaeon]